MAGHPDGRPRGVGLDRARDEGVSGVDPVVDAAMRADYALQLMFNGILFFLLGLTMGFLI